MLQEKRGDICQNMSQYGHGKGTQYGGCCEYSSVPAKYCYVLTRNITPTQAVILEPMGKFSDVKIINIQFPHLTPFKLIHLFPSKFLKADLIY